MSAEITPNVAAWFKALDAAVGIRPPGYVMPFLTPYSCAECGIPSAMHGRRWHPEAGMHQWAAPTGALILARMLARCAVRTNTTTPTGGTTHV
jgi:hypothetical protein